MKAILDIDDGLMSQLAEEATRQDRTVSELVEAALRMFLRSPRQRQALGSLPQFHSGGALEIADRDALYEAMEGR